jgi:hypothetical protein
MGGKGLILGGGGFMDGGAPRFVLALLDLDAPSPAAELITLPFLPHGIVIDPRDPGRAAVFEKKGPGACLVDLRARPVIRPLSTVATRRFYGHGAFSADGSLLYATESQLDRRLAGVPVVRDAQTLKELGTVPTHGTAPHDCLLLDDGKTMVVANGGGPMPAGSEGSADREPASVTYVDLTTERLLDEVRLASPRFNTGHVAVTGRGDLAVVSAPRDGLPTPNQQLGAVTLRPHGGATATPSRHPSTSCGACSARRSRSSSTRPTAWCWRRTRSATASRCGGSTAASAWARWSSWARAVSPARSTAPGTWSATSPAAACA